MVYFDTFTLKILLRGLIRRQFATPLFMFDAQGALLKGPTCFDSCPFFRSLTYMAVIRLYGKECRLWCGINAKECILSVEVTQNQWWLGSRQRELGVDQGSSSVRNYWGCERGPSRVYKEKARKVIGDFSDKREKPVIGCVAAGPDIGKISYIYFMKNCTIHKQCRPLRYNGDSMRTWRNLGGRAKTATAGSDVVQSGRPIFDDFFQHLWPYIGNNTANVVFQMVKRLWLIRIHQ
ncbi:hypothetical protein TNCV_514221 [Trichonephila clavipes]|nr:hypothetical protein TNCV_514221 [Trichonephila clavipes]